MSTPGTPSPSRLAVGGFAAFALSIPLAGAFHPDYSHVREGISALAATDSPAAPIMIAGFLALALGTVAAGVALWVRLPVGVADHHVVHQLASLAVFLVLVIAMFPSAHGLRRNGGPAGVAVATRLVGVVGLLVITAMMTVGLGDFGGLVQRLFIALLFGAPVVLACLQRTGAATGAPVGRSR